MKRPLASLALLLAIIGLTFADNPIIQTIYTADPAPYVYNDTIWLFADHDEDAASSFFLMKEWRLYSSTDVVNWQDYGVIASLASTFKWATDRAWAPQAVERNGIFYMYCPVQVNGGAMAIGVATSKTITGPYVDALGKPLVQNNNIDPTVWIDDDGQAYLYFGNPGFSYVKLNKDMISYSGSVINANKPNGFVEAPWLHKRNGKYYLSYASNGIPESISYSTSTSPTGPWNGRGGTIMAAAGSSFTNHQGIIDYKNHSLFFYHNGALPGGGGYHRSICIEDFTYGSDGSIPTLKMTTAGAAQIGSLDPYVRTSATTMAFSSGVKTEKYSEGFMDVTNTNANGAYIKVKGVDFGTTGATSLSVRVASPGGNGRLTASLGSRTGTVIATCTVAATGGTQKWATVNCPVTGAKGKNDLYWTFSGSFGFAWWQFSATKAASKARGFKA
ncbi:putative Arabinoxylan arabinofuranohydrolase [Chaetomium strumarium]|uniref:Arabinoxylan arabinofuranohydrolase n=1 Tax=Chaetomium strumarium TaxID=1170767 RepID=A0AAJ0M399_9PEZI|nr:putative Arabinoxylan arabinofuranohydrolase [Chaetomium strumarium]